MAIAGILLGGGLSTRFGAPKLEARLFGRRLMDIACGHFLDAGLSPVVFAGRGIPEDPRVIRAGAGRTMIETLRLGLQKIPDDHAFAFAPADMPALFPALIRSLAEEIAVSPSLPGATARQAPVFLIPCHGGRRGHPAFARDRAPFFELGDEGGAREIWRARADEIVHREVVTADILFDIDTPDDLAAAGDRDARLARLRAKGSL